MSKNITLDDLISDIAKKLNIKTVFDIGANNGTWTKKYEKLLPNSTFYMFEANPTKKKPNNVNPKHIWQTAVLSDTIKTIDFYAINGTGDSYYKEMTTSYEGCTPIKLNTTTLDSFSFPLPEIIKIDTQGAEIDIINGAKEIFKQCKILQIEMPILSYNKASPSFDVYINTLRNLGLFPIGLNELHFIEGILIQIDLVFVNETVRNLLFCKIQKYQGI